MPQEVPAKTRVVPATGGSKRATNWEIRFDGGSFDFHAYEFRENDEVRATPTVEAWDLVEVGRFAVSPVSLERLVEQIDAAKRTYYAVMGRNVPTDIEVRPKMAEHTKKVRSAITAASTDKKAIGK